MHMRISDCVTSKSRRQYSADFMKGLRDNPWCKEAPVDFNIPKEILAESSPPSSAKLASAKGSGWRSQAERRPAKKGGQEGKTTRYLQSSEKSWAVTQQAKKKERDEMVTRRMKAILNKLTVERFAVLYQQLLECGIEAKEHIETLMREVFEKATMQHHFVEMYTSLCIKLSVWLSARDHTPGENGEAVSFKRILLNQCQDSFERYLKPPDGLQALSSEDRDEAKFRYKTKMLGNIKFVGQLLIHRVLSSKIIFLCVEELLLHSSEETLETLCAFLVAIGPAFDSPAWRGHRLFHLVFDKVRELAELLSAVPPRIRCLL